MKKLILQPVLNQGEVRQPLIYADMVTRSNPSPGYFLYVKEGVEKG